MTEHSVQCTFCNNIELVEIDDHVPTLEEAMEDLTWYEAVQVFTDAVAGYIKESSYSDKRRFVSQITTELAREYE